MSPGGGSKGKDPKLEKLAEEIKKAPFGPDEPAKVEGGAKKAIADALAKKFGKGGR